MKLMAEFKRFPVYAPITTNTGNLINSSLKYTLKSFTSHKQTYVNDNSVQITDILL